MYISTANYGCCHRKQQCTPYVLQWRTSLGWVTPGAATEGVTPLFFPEKPVDLFLLIAVTITIAFYCFHSGVTPSRVSPHTFFTCPTSFLHYSF